MSPPLCPQRPLSLPLGLPSGVSSDKFDDEPFDKFTINFQPLILVPSPQPISCRAWIQTPSTSLLSLCPSHHATRGLGSWGWGWGTLTEVSMHRQRGWAAGGTGNLRMYGSSRSSASYSAMTWRRYCFLGRQPADRDLPKSGVHTITLRGAEIRSHGARDHSRGFDGSAQALSLRLL